MTDNLEARVMKAMRTIPAPRTSQDTADKLAAELAVAGFMRHHANARYDAAKAAIIDNFNDDIEGIKKRATADMTKYTVYIDGQDWKVECIAATPQTRVNVDDLRTELVKAGVDIKLIDRSIKKVEKKSAPALTLRTHQMNSNTGK